MTRECLRGGTLAGESFTEETKEEIRKLQTWTQEERTVCRSSGVREKGVETAVETGVETPVETGVETGVETAGETGAETG